MAKTVKIEVRDQDPITSLQGFLARLLSETDISALLVPQHLPMRNSVMPTLVSDPDKLSGADPLAPAFPFNAAKIVSRLTRKPSGSRVAAVLRPCEMRAFVELVKLKQGTTDELVTIGVDCLGAYSNVGFARYAAGVGSEATLQFHRNIRQGKGTQWQDVDLAPACQACEYPVVENSDLTIGLLGVDFLNDQMLVIANTPQGEAVLDMLQLPGATATDQRKEAIAALVAARTTYRDAMFEATSEATADLEKLMNYLANCVNCYNCRVACPVCYCKECVFVTDVFDHEPTQYLRWARRKGILKMPTDTVFFHVTRLAHMSTACVGCGQCSNACPNNVPVMELFRTIASHTQAAFDYVAGRNVEEEPPLSVFREHEFSEVTGGKD